MPNRRKKIGNGEEALKCEAQRDQQQASGVSRNSVSISDMRIWKRTFDLMGNALTMFSKMWHSISTKREFGISR